MYRRIALGIGITLLIGALLYSTFGSVSVCRQCGSKRNTIEFQVPFTSLTYWSRHAIEETEMSRTARRAGLTGVHTHDWVFVHGSGNGVTCAIGTGSNIFDNVHLPEVVSFVACTSRYRKLDEAAEWLETALDPVKGRAICQWLTVEQFPENGFESAADYENWRNRSDRSWPGILDHYREQQ